MANKGKKPGSGLAAVILLLISLVLAACGDSPKPTPDYSSALTPIASRPTVTPPYLPATNITPEPTGVASAAPVALAPTPTSAAPTAVPPTPLLIPTPSSPTEGVLTADSLGITGWTDTEINWSPTGDQFVLHTLRGEDQFDFYFLVRPPASPTASFKLSRTVYGSIVWSPDGRYISYIDQDAEGNPGPVRVIDTVNGLTQPRELFKGPCTNAAWLSASKVVAACGQAVYVLNPEVESNPSPDVLYKLDGGRFPGSTMDLNLIVRALPSPDGAMVAMYGLAKQKSSLPLGEIAFLTVASNKLTILERNNRAVAMLDWTPDSKYLVLRNLTGDWAVPYTFDFYLADPARQRILQNLTRSNDKCDPVLGAKPECQGLQPSPYQATRLIFGPDSNRFLTTGVRYLAQPNVALETVERLSQGALSGGKQDKPLELASGERVVGLTWLPNGHYFYSRSPLKGPAQAVLDGQVVTLNSPALNALVKSGTPQANKTTSTSPRPTVTGTRIASADQGFNANNTDDTEIANNNTAVTPGSLGTPPGSPSIPALSPTPTGNAAAPAGTPAPTQPIVFPTVPTQSVSFPGAGSTITPAGTQIINIYTATPEPRSPTPASRPSPTPKASVTPRPDTVQLRPIGFYASPPGNWVISLERIASNDKSVQFQIRLIPFSLK